MKLIQTIMMKSYLVKLGIRIAIFLGVVVFYFYDKNLMMQWFHQSVFLGITPIHILWAIFMVMMIKHLFPKEPFTMALVKSEKEKYVPVENYSKLELLEFVQDQNIKAWKVMAVWLIGNGIVGLLYSFDVIGQAELFLLTVFYFLCDYICILFYCPFQSHMMKNKCCVNCRIYDWGHFMMFTPMMFIHSFYSLSLFLTGCVVLVHWEIIYAKHPERFYEGSNQVLKCVNCKDRTCQIKNRITKRNIM